MSELQPIPGAAVAHDMAMLNALVAEHPEWREQFAFLEAQREPYNNDNGFVLVLWGKQTEHAREKELLGVLDPTTGDEVEKALLGEPKKAKESSESDG